MKILSLFDGISCARVALERAGIPVEVYYASEIDKYAIQVSQKNWPSIIQVGCVKGISHTFLKDNFLKDIDLLIGGSPCQDLSIAKKDRKGLDGEKSGLFWEYVRILKEVKPKYFILENVNSMPKEAKELITKTLGVQPIMINAALVSAQNRKRLFWTNIPGVTLPEDKGILLKDILEENVDEKYNTGMDFTKRFDYTLHKEPYDKKGQSLRATDYKGTHNMIVFNKNGEEKLKSNTIRTSGKSSGIDDKHNWDTIRIGEYNKGGQGDRIYSPEGKSVGLSALGGGRGAKTGLYLVVPEATKKGYAVATDGQSVDLSFPTSKTRRGRVGDKVKNLMTSQNIGVFTEGIVRKLTPTECHRLQGLPDGYCDGISNSQQYKCLGNAFNVDVVAHILSFIK